MLREEMNGNFRQVGRATVQLEKVGDRSQNLRLKHLECICFDCQAIDIAAGRDPHTCFLVPQGADDDRTVLHLKSLHGEGGRTMLHA